MKRRIVSFLPSLDDDIYPVIPESQVILDPLRFPDGIMGGFAGDFARVYSATLEPPEHSFYIAALTCLGSMLSGLIRIESEIKSDPRFYVLLLGLSGSAKKSTANSKTIDFFRETLDGPRTAGMFRTCQGVGSAEGLQDLLTADKWNKRLLLCFDEFKAFVGKCRIDSSVLLPCVTTLFESNRYENRTKGKGISLEDVHLSILTASTIDTYEQCWDSAFTDIGFNNRLFIVPGNSVRRFSLPPAIKTRDRERLQKFLLDIIYDTRTGVTYPIEPIARSFYDAWYLGLGTSPHATRLDTYATRFMSLMAANERKETVDLDIILKVTKLCDWQMKVRTLYDPIRADNKAAMMEQKIRKILRVHPRITAKRLKDHANAHRSGLFIFNQAMKNLRESGEIVCDDGLWNLSDEA